MGVSAENAKVRKSERELGGRSERKQSWKDSVGPACKGWDAVLSSLPGREVPVRVSKQKCDTVRGAFPIHHPSCSVDVT